MSFWGEIDPKKNKKEVLTQIRVPESLKPQRKRQPAVIIKGEEKLKSVESLSCPRIRRILDLPEDIPEKSEISDNLQLDYSCVESIVLHSIKTLVKVQGFDAVDQDVLDNLVDLVQHFLTNFGEICQGGLQSIENILNEVLSKIGISKDGVSGLVEALLEYLSPKFNDSELYSSNGLIPEIRKPRMAGNPKKARQVGQSDPGKMDVDETTNDFVDMNSGLDTDLVGFVPNLSSQPTSDYRRLDVLMPQVEDFNDDPDFKAVFGNSDIHLSGKI